MVLHTWQSTWQSTWLEEVHKPLRCNKSRTPTILPLWVLLHYSHTHSSPQNTLGVGTHDHNNLPLNTLGYGHKSLNTYEGSTREIVLHRTSVYSNLVGGSSSSLEFSQDTMLILPFPRSLYLSLWFEALT